MLNGIGGRTIEEAQHALSYPEFLSWVRFRNKYGPLHASHRLDQIVGRVASVFSSIMLRKQAFKPEDFSPYLQSPEDEEATIDEAFQMLASVAQPEKPNDGD